MFGRKRVTTTLESEADLNKKLKILAEVNKAVTEIDQLNSTLGKIFKGIDSSLGYKASLLMVNKENQTLEAFNINSSAETLIKMLFPDKKGVLSVPLNYENKEDMGLAVKCYYKGEMILSNSMYDIVKPLLPKAASDTVQKLIFIDYGVVVPVKIKGEVIAVVTAGSRKEITKEDSEILKGFADLAGIAIYNSRLFTQTVNQVDQLTKKNEDLSSLYNLTANVSRSLDPFKVAQAAVNSIPQDKLMVGAVLSRFYPDKNYIAPLVASENQVSYAARKLIGDFSQYGLSLDDPNGQTNLVVRVVKTETAMFSNDLSEYLTPAVASNFIDPIAKLLNIKSVAVFPLIIRGRTIGALSFMIKEKNAEEIDANEKQLLQTYTNQVAIALENANLFAQSQEIQAKLEKTLQELEAARKHERDMIDIMGHELRTPMSIVRNALIMMDTQIKANPEDLMDKIKKYVEIGVESARREVSLIETLLSATKTDGKGFQLLLEKIDLDDIINNSLIAFKREADKKGLQLAYEKPLTPVVVYADRTRIQEIADNFINNAVKYTMRGSVTIKVFQENGFGYVSVKDTGIGISEEDLTKLGQKFFRARQYIDDVEDEDLPPERLEVVRPGGTGLGLYVTFNLIKIMDGKLDVQSKLKEGSTFTFGMPSYTNQQPKQIERKIEPQE